MIKKFITSKQTLKVYSGFLVNVSAGIFLLIPLSPGLWELTWRIFLTIIGLGFAIFLERKIR